MLPGVTLVTVFVGTAQRTKRVKLDHGALVGDAPLRVRIELLLVLPALVMFATANVVRFPSLKLLMFEFAACGSLRVAATAPNKNTDVCPACAPTPPSLLPVVSGAVAAGVTIEPTKNLPLPLIA